MLKNYIDFVKFIKSQNTNEEMLSEISKEMARIRCLSKDENTIDMKYNNIKKCLFIYILGINEDISFIHMVCMELLTSQELKYKKLGYLSLSLLLNPESEFIILTVNCIKNDLNSNNNLLVEYALNFINDLYSDFIYPQILPEILKLIDNENIKIKAKAINTMNKIYNNFNDYNEYSIILLGKLNEIIIKDKFYIYHNLLLSVFQLYINIIEKIEEDVKKRIIPHKVLKKLIKILKYLNDNNDNENTQYEINYIFDPFLQYKLLKLIKVLIINFKSKFIELNDFDELNNLLASISINTNFQTQTGKAILYELIKTILNINLNDSLNELGVNIIFKFLEENDINYKKISFNLLNEVSRNKEYINKYLKKNNDILNALLNNIKNFSGNSNEIDFILLYFNLIFKLTDSNNLKENMKICINFIIINNRLNIIDDNFYEMLLKVIDLNSLTFKYEYDMIINILKLRKNFSEKILNKIIYLFLKIKELYKYIINCLINILPFNLNQFTLIKITLYLIGHIYNYLDFDKCNDDNLIELFNNIKNNNEETIIIFLLNCYFKLLINKNFKISEKLENFIKNELKFYCNNQNIEIQERAFQYYYYFQNKKNETIFDFNKCLNFNKFNYTYYFDNKIIYNKDFDDDNEEIKYIESSDYNKTCVFNNNLNNENKNINDKNIIVNNNLIEFDNINDNLNNKNIINENKTIENINDLLNNNQINNSDNKISKLMDDLNLLNFQTVKIIDKENINIENKDLKEEVKDDNNEFIEIKENDFDDLFKKEVKENKNKNNILNNLIDTNINIEKETNLNKNKEILIKNKNEENNKYTNEKKESITEEIIENKKTEENNNNKNEKENINYTINENSKNEEIIINEEKKEENNKENI